jgi:hypothetical protein
MGTNIMMILSSVELIMDHYRRDYRHRFELFERFRIIDSSQHMKGMLSIH